MRRAVWNRLLDATREAYANSAALTGFAPLPNDLAPQPVTPHHVPGSDLLQSEVGLVTETHPSLRDAAIAAAPVAHWRETYKGTDIGQDFLDRFGCYAIIGEGGAFASDQLWAWIVYMPRGLYYPWHHHPGEEIYLVVAGEAEFQRKGEPGTTLRPGDTAFHASNQPHATTTRDRPALCLVIWRNGFDTAPVLTPSGAGG